MRNEIGVRTGSGGRLEGLEIPYIPLQKCLFTEYKGVLSWEAEVLYSSLVFERTISRPSLA